MTYIAPLHESLLSESLPAALTLAIAKLNKSKRPPRVNLPALARRDQRFMSAWKADPGHVFISSDFVSLEPSITASFAGDPNYRYATFDGIGQTPHVTPQGVLMIDDIYLMTASVMPGISDPVLSYFSNVQNITNWTQDPEIAKKDLSKARKQAKTACLGFNYGMGPKKFVSQCYDAGTSITFIEAQAMYAAYWNLFSGLKKFVAQLEAYMKKNKFIMNPFGYRLTTDPHKGYNAFIQSTASGVLDVFCLKFFALCPDISFVAMIHDEVVYQVKIGDVERARQAQEQCLVSLNEDIKFNIPMRLGFTVAEDFYGLK